MRTASAAMECKAPGCMRGTQIWKCFGDLGFRCFDAISETAVRYFRVYDATAWVPA